MKIQICAIGRIRSGPEADLISDYLGRFQKYSRNLGLGAIDIIELEDKRGGSMAREGELLLRAAGSAGALCCLDERGKAMTSPEFAQFIQAKRDDGESQMSFIIGGAAGLDPAVRAACQHKISFGKMVWPHALVRVMLAEQIYRAATILSGAPYHKA